MIFHLGRFIICALWIIVLQMAGKVSPAICADAHARPFPALYAQPQIYQTAIANAQRIPSLTPAVTGLTIPHHALAVELMASTLALARAQEYERIVIFGPDHFCRGKTFFSVSIRPFSTCFGPVPIDTQAIRHVMTNPHVSSSNLFSHEHGVQAVLPLVAHYFPRVPVLAMAIHPAAKKDDWDTLVQTLLPVISPKTLIIQSTDFSHYLSWPKASIHDQETLHILASGNADAISLLQQPGHLDSRGAQYVHMKLQDLTWKARPTVLANANSCEFVSPQEAMPKETTSYIVQIYSPHILPSITLPTRGAPRARYFFAGDFFTGRFVTTQLADPAQKQKFLDMILAHTRGAPLILNFEGVLAPRCPPEYRTGAAQGQILPPAQWQLCMPQELTLEMLNALHVAAVSLANNHSYDHGPQGYQQTKNILEEHGIRVVESGQITSFSDFNLVAWTDVENSHPKRRNLLTRNDLIIPSEALTQKPLWALMHWGQEGRPKPGPREEWLARHVHDLGVSLIVGHHPHRAGELYGNSYGLTVWSLGNFLFDQAESRADGALLEVNIFPQGSFWVRSIPLDPFFILRTKSGSWKNAQAETIRAQE